MARLKRWLLAVDFDGTLAPIAALPGGVRPLGAARRALARLAARTDVAVAVISGRSLSDVRRRVGLRGLTYGGNHGAELAGPWGRWRHPAWARARPRLAGAAARLRRELAGRPGLLVEDKGLSLSVHYRLAPRGTGPALERRLRRLCAETGLSLSPGKKVWELRPAAPWGKGKALLWLRRRLGCAGSPVFIGDDATDEDAFRALGSAAFTVRVGRGRSRARYRVAGPGDVARLLDAAASALGSSVRPDRGWRPERGPARRKGPRRAARPRGRRCSP
ncbi:MAG: trehalose-phosphatase [Elusimicrobia bacterium]|nr:trehalose-phosphatase [Elusimicrobiota bacterium]